MPYLSIEFSSADLLRLRPATSDPMWDAVLSLHLLQRSERLSAPLRRWRDASCDSLTRSLTRADLLDLFAVTPYASYFPDFLTPGDGTALASQLKRIEATDPHRVQAELATTPERPRSLLRHQLVHNGPRGLQRLTRLLAAYVRHISPLCAAQRRSDLAALRRSQNDAVATGGFEALLRSFAPEVAVWNAPVLKVAYPIDQTLELGGRGLTLVPSWFCDGKAVSLADPALPPVLVYPVQTADEASRGSQRVPSPRSLSSLLGHTRARVLLACDGGSTTSIAARLELSPSTTSEHISVLRNARLVSTTKVQTHTHHRRTVLGDDLVDGRSR